MEVVDEACRNDAGRRVRKVQLLVSGKKPVYRDKGGVVSLELPSIGLHEVIAIDLA